MATYKASQKMKDEIIKNGASRTFVEEVISELAILTAQSPHLKFLTDDLYSDMDDGIYPISVLPGKQKNSWVV